MIASIGAGTVAAIQPWPVALSVQPQEGAWEQASQYDTLAPFGTVRTIRLTGATLVNQLSSIASARGTTSGFNLVIIADDLCKEKSGRELVAELRLLTGLNWSQIAKLADVSTRTVHNWMSGSVVAKTNHERLGALVSTIRFIDRGYGDANRAILLGDVGGGSTVFKLLVEGAFDDVKERVGEGPGRGKGPRPFEQNGISSTRPMPFGTELSEARVKDDLEVLPATELTRRKAPSRRKKD
ncbi:MAG: hypothetical protein AAFY84_16725 [Pseudomonadota bacterium]